MTDDQLEALERVQEAVTMLSCPFLQSGADGTAVCQSGCWDEPACVTNRPAGGWIPYLRRAVDDLALAEVGEAL